MQSGKELALVNEQEPLKQSPATEDVDTRLFVHALHDPSMIKEVPTFLPLETIQAMATSFIQIWPGAISAEALNADGDANAE